MNCDSLADTEQSLPGPSSALQKEAGSVALFGLGVSGRGFSFVLGVLGLAPELWEMQDVPFVLSFNSCELSLVALLFIFALMLEDFTSEVLEALVTELGVAGV